MARHILKIVWHGRRANGLIMLEIAVSYLVVFAVTALAGEEAVESVSFIRGRVTGTVPSGTDPLLLLGDLAVPLSRVEEIAEGAP